MRQASLELIPSFGGFLAEHLLQVSARRTARQLSWLRDLQDTTGLSVDEFARAMAEDPVLTACFDVTLVAAADAPDTTTVAPYDRRGAGLSRARTR
jgi:hypothetical protein